MDPVIAEVNDSIIGIITIFIGWSGVIILFVLVRNFIIAGISRAFIQVFEGSNEKNKEILVKYLIDKNSTLREIYDHLKKFFKEE